MMHGLVIAMMVSAAQTGAVDPLFERVVAERTTEAPSEAGVRWMKATDPQSLAKVLIQTKLLETLHRFQAAPKTSDGALDPSVMSRVGAINIGGRHYAFLYKDEALKVAMVRIPVPVAKQLDPKEGWSADRLSPLKRTLQGLAKYRLQPVERDEYDNVFAWKGSAAGGRVFVRHVSADDEVIVLFVAS